MVGASGKGKGCRVLEGTRGGNLACPPCRRTLDALFATCAVSSTLLACRRVAARTPLHAGLPI